MMRMTSSIRRSLKVCTALMGLLAVIVGSTLQSSVQAVWSQPAPEAAVFASTATGNNFRIDLVRIPAGTFLMGNPSPEQFGRYSKCEGPQHEVRISRSFLMSKYEITVQQFRAFSQSTGYQTDAERNGLGCNGLDLQSGQVTRTPDRIWKSPGFMQTDEHPVTCVSWHDAAEFCRWLSETTDRICRLPTEAEWEYCCRAKSQSMFSVGDTIASMQSVANCGDQSLAAAFANARGVAQWDDSFAFTAPVGSFAANQYGLHDMHGNVGEWCRDWFAEDYYRQSRAEDPTGPKLATEWRVVRGGSWYNTPSSCRSSGRHDGIETAASTTNGFRVVVELNE